jgi:hypothetical protein
MPEDTLDADAVKYYLNEVASELTSQGPPLTIVIVGGSLLALLGLRDSTRDVDTIRRLDNELVLARDVVAQRHDLSSTWLNDAAAGFVPVTFRDEDCEPLLETGRLVAVRPAYRVVFAMKLLAYRVTDVPDLRRLWGACDFESAAEAVDFFYESYPHEEFDEYLTALIDRSIVAHGSSGG